MDPIMFLFGMVTSACLATGRIIEAFILAGIAITISLKYN